MITIMNTNILGFSMESSSLRKNWIVIAFAFMIGLSIIVNNMLPVINQLGNMIETNTLE